MNYGAPDVCKIMNLKLVPKLTDAEKRDPHFEVGDDCQMLVTETSYSGERYTSYKYFKIRARRYDSGRWVYQLDDMVTGQKYKTEAWFPERAVKDIA